MATLVLTAIGTALGGPLGGALGAMLGQSADAVLFAPKARQGPRLSDLKVQTSSYGDGIPCLYGVMRVAGTVIWATDLIERRQSRSSGKGRPKVVEYSYSASFAVALSARRIAAIKRIWADGRLLRDESGRFAESVTFRSYPGDADQAADPLIASAIGIDRASAFRGTAYALFEDLDLSAFGNRIPQLSFEVEADSEALDVGRITMDLLGTAGASGGPEMTGFAASAGRVRDALAPLAEFASLGVQVAGGNAVVTPSDLSGEPAIDGRIAQVHVASRLRAEEDRRIPLARVPGQIMLRHFDPSRDFQTSQQSADVAGGGGPVRQIELAGALVSSEAQSRVRQLARAAGDGRRVVEVRAGLGALTLPVGSQLTLDIAEVAERRWRIAERRIESGGVVLTLVRYAQAAEPVAALADGGVAIVSANLPALDADLFLFDVPGDGDVVRTAPLRLIAAAGRDPSWRGADLWWVGGAGTEPEPLGRLTGAAVMGAIENPLGSAVSWLIDWSNPIDVTMSHAAMELANIEMVALVAGGNLAMIGCEAVQFARATPLGARRWRLEGLLRGRGGTKAPAGGHDAGTPFVLLGDAALFTVPDAMALQVSNVTGAVDWQARGGGLMQRADVPAGQQALVPLAPVHGRAVRLSNGDAIVSWIACSRAGARWRDGVDVPAGETSTSWRLRWTDASLAQQERNIPAAALELAAGSYAPGTVLTVEQRGDFALSAPLNILLPD